MSRTHPLAHDEQGRLLIDVRGPRFGAVLTTAVLAIALVVQGPLGWTLVAWQWLAFAISTVAGLAWSPYGNVFRWVKRRFDLGPPTATEPEGPPRFAQACGLGVLSVALGLAVAGAPTAAWAAVGVVVALSALLATTGLCIGCELYVLGQRLGASRSDAGASHSGAAPGSPSGGEGGPLDGEGHARVGVDGEVR